MAGRSNVVRHISTGLVLACFLLADHACAYKTSTHAEFTGKGADISNLNLDAQLANSLGINTYTIARFPFEPGGPRHSIRQLLQRGSAEADATDLGLGVRFHFYDPQNYRGLTADDGHPSFLSSVEWALEVQTELGNPFSYRDARVHFWNALTLRNRSSREVAFGKTFEALGHVVHHIQDMGQPQHTRNDIHCSAELPCRLLIPLLGFQDPYQISRYEDYAEAQSARIPSIDSGRYEILRLRGDLIFSRPQDYWQNVSFGPAIGMAEFTSHNFVSQRTNLRISSSGALITHPDYPLPSRQNLSGISSFNTACVFTGNFATRSGASCPYLVASLQDALNPGLLRWDGTRIATFSVFARTQSENGVARDLSINDTVLDDRLSILFPRTVYFTGGLLDYFFRGQLSFVPDQNGDGWRLRNDSRESLTGQVAIRYETTSGSRKTFPCCVNPEEPLSIVPGGTSQLFELDYPGDFNGRLVAGYRGRLGAEGNASGAGFYSVVGEVHDIQSQSVTITLNDIIGDDAFSLLVDGETIGILPTGDSHMRYHVDMFPGVRYDVAIRAEVSNKGATYEIIFPSNLTVLAGGDPFEGELDQGDYARWEVVLQP